MCLSVQVITFELLKLWTSFLAYRYILTLSRSSLSIKVIGSRSRSNEKFTYFYPTVAYLKGQCHLEVKVRATLYQGQLKRNKFSVYLQTLWSMCYADGTPSTQRQSYWLDMCMIPRQQKVTKDNLWNCSSAMKPSIERWSIYTDLIVLIRQSALML